MALEDDQEYKVNTEDHDNSYDHPNCNELISFNAYPPKENCDTSFYQSTCGNVKDLIAPPPLNSINILNPISQNFIKGRLPSQRLECPFRVNRRGVGQCHI